MKSFFDFKGRMTSFPSKPQGSVIQTSDSLKQHQSQQSNVYVSSDKSNHHVIPNVVVHQNIDVQVVNNFGAPELVNRYLAFAGQTNQSSQFPVNYFRPRATFKVSQPSRQFFNQCRQPPQLVRHLTQPLYQPRPFILGSSCQQLVASDLLSTDPALPKYPKTEPLLQTCNLCKKQFETRDEIKSHLYQEHSEALKKATENRAKNVESASQIGSQLSVEKESDKPKVTCVRSLAEPLTCKSEPLDELTDDVEVPNEPSVLSSSSNSASLSSSSSWLFKHLVPSIYRSNLAGNSCSTAPRRKPVAVKTKRPEKQTISKDRKRLNDESSPHKRRKRKKKNDTKTAENFFRSLERDGGSEVSTNVSNFSNSERPSCSSSKDSTSIDSGMGSTIWSSSVIIDSGVLDNLADFICAKTGNKLQSVNNLTPVPKSTASDNSAVEECALSDKSHSFLCNEKLKTAAINEDSNISDKVSASGNIASNDDQTNPDSQLDKPIITTNEDASNDSELNLDEDFEEAKESEELNASKAAPAKLDLQVNEVIIVTSKDINKNSVTNEDTTKDSELNEDEESKEKEKRTADDKAIEIFSSTEESPETDCHNTTAELIVSTSDSGSEIEIFSGNTVVKSPTASKRAQNSPVKFGANRSPGVIYDFTKPRFSSRVERRRLIDRQISDFFKDKPSNMSGKLKPVLDRNICAGCGIEFESFRSLIKHLSIENVWNCNLKVSSLYVTQILYDSAPTNQNARRLPNEIQMKQRNAATIRRLLKNVKDKADEMSSLFKKMQRKEVCAQVTASIISTIQCNSSRLADVWFSDSFETEVRARYYLDSISILSQPIMMDFKSTNPMWAQIRSLASFLIRTANEIRVRSNFIDVTNRKESQAVYSFLQEAVSLVAKNKFVEHFDNFAIQEGL